MLKGKKAIVFGERDDISGKTVSACLVAAGAEIVYEATACFVWTSAGAVGLAAQEEVKKLAEKYGSEDLVVVFGLNQPFTLRIMAQTFKEGDPSYAGPLAGVALGLKSYHILELKDEIPEELWDDNMGMAELELEDEVQAEIKGVMAEVR